MKFTEFLQSEKSKPEGAALFLAGRTKNIYEINHLVDKGFLPAVLTRLELAANKNELVIVDKLKEQAEAICPDEFKSDIKLHVEHIIKEHTPQSILKNDRKIFQPM